MPVLYLNIFHNVILWCSINTEYHNTFSYFAIINLTSYIGVPQGSVLGPLFIQHPQAPSWSWYQNIPPHFLFSVRKTENYSKEKRKKNIYIKRENEAGVRAGQGNSWKDFNTSKGQELKSFRSSTVAGQDCALLRISQLSLKVTPVWLVRERSWYPSKGA